LVDYLKVHLREGDKILDGDLAYMPAILHYFGAYPKGRHQAISYRKDGDKRVEYKVPFVYKNKIYTLYWSATCCDQYVQDGSRLWIVVGKNTGKKFMVEKSPFVFKGYFDGSFLNFNKFPTDGSIYLLLYDPRSPEEKGIDLPIE
jgi:hypothetical protein